MGNLERNVQNCRLSNLIHSHWNLKNIQIKKMDFGIPWQPHTPQQKSVAENEMQWLKMKCSIHEHVWQELEVC